MKIITIYSFSTLFIFMLAGCFPVRKTPRMTDISRSDATITFEYESTDALLTFDRIDWEDVKHRARTECIKLGYGDVRLLNTSRNCIESDSSGCVLWRYVRKCQCIDKEALPGFKE